MKPDLTNRDLWLAWILPILVALLVAAVLVIERMQVDWTVSCPRPGKTACNDAPFADLFGWLPVPLAYGAVHIWGARQLIAGPQTVTARLMRGMAVCLFIAINIFPFPGWYLFYAGVAGGIAISLTVIGLVVAPAVGVLVAGIFAGLVLGLCAGPAWRSMTWAGWKVLLWGYSLGGALSAAFLALGQIVFDPAFGNTLGANMPWLTALGTLVTVLAVGIITSTLAWRGWVKGSLPAVAGPAVSRFAWPVALAAALIVPIHLMVTQELTIFRRDGAPIPALAAMLRGYKPGVAQDIALADMTNVGPRAFIAKRGITRRERMETSRIDRGGGRWSSSSVTVYDDFEQWELNDTSSVNPERITVTADRSAQRVTYECEPGLKVGEEFCATPEPIYRDDLRKTFAIAFAEEAFLLSVNAPNATLGIRFDARKTAGPDRCSRPQLYCRLNLTSVTTANFSVMQIIPCDADWIFRAAQLRARLEREFLPAGSVAIGSRP